LNASDTAGLRSISIFNIRILSAIRCRKSSNIGFIILHGPHHSAVKSIRTNLSPEMISPKVSFLFSVAMCFAFDHKSHNLAIFERKVIYLYLGDKGCLVSTGRAKVALRCHERAFSICMLRLPFTRTLVFSKFCC
jgi:hypothetical protein